MAPISLDIKITLPLRDRCYGSKSARRASAKAIESKVATSLFWLRQGLLVARCRWAITANSARPTASTNAPTRTERATLNRVAKVTKAIGRVAANFTVQTALPLRPHSPATSRASLDQRHLASVPRIPPAPAHPDVHHQEDQPRCE